MTGVVAMLERWAESASYLSARTQRPRSLGHAAHRASARAHPSPCDAESGDTRASLTDHAAGRVRAHFGRLSRRCDPRGHPNGAQPASFVARLRPRGTAFKEDEAPHARP